MTNEEKIGNVLRVYNYMGRLTPQGVYGFVFDRCKEIAKWKDAQFEDTKDEIIVDAKKELAWEIHKIIANGATLAEVDNYVCGICDF